MADKTILAPQREIPVLYDVDVAVVGGGTAGPVAAIAAARAGASTVLIERYGGLGGCATIGRCFHITNRFVDGNDQEVLSGLPVEIMKRAVAAGATFYPDYKRTIHGSHLQPNFVVTDPEILSVVLMQMCEEAGVKLLLQTDCYDVLTEGDKVTGVLVNNKSGRQAVLAKCVVDSSGEADVAYGAGAPCFETPTAPTAGTYGNTFGLLIRLNNVDLDRFMDYFLNLPAGTPDPSFTEWLVKYVGKSEEELRAIRYWRMFLDPQPESGGTPFVHRGEGTFRPQTLAWYRQWWEQDGYFGYIHMHYFRDLMRKAVDAGDFEINEKIAGFGEIGFNFDGLTGGKFRDREVLINAINPMWGFDAFNPEHISKVEVAARERGYHLLDFLKKYMPGFEDAWLVDSGVKTMPRHPRMIKSIRPLTMADLEKSSLDDAVFVTIPNSVPDKAYEFPYGMMVPQKVDGVIVAGKCSDGAPIVRSIASTMTQAQAAGAAAALCAKHGVAPRNLDLDLLRAEQRRQGARARLTD